MFRENRWDVRLINLRGFVETPQVTPLTGELPNGVPLCVGFRSIDTDEFFARSDATCKKSGMNELIETVKVGRSRAAGAG
jgi:hypothetical protein